MNHSDTSPGFKFYRKTSLSGKFGDIFGIDLIWSTLQAFLFSRLFPSVVIPQEPRISSGHIFGGQVKMNEHTLLTSDNQK